MVVGKHRLAILHMETIAAIAAAKGIDHPVSWCVAIGQLRFGTEAEQVDRRREGMGDTLAAGVEHKATVPLPQPFHLLCEHLLDGIRDQRVDVVLLRDLFEQLLHLCEFLRLAVRQVDALVKVLIDVIQLPHRVIH